MTVRIRQKQSAGFGGLGATLWEDDFNLNIADTRINYLFHSTTDDTDITPAIAAGNLSWSGGVTTTAIIGWQPVAIGGIRGREQFSEVTYVAASANNRSGPCVLSTGDGRSGGLGGFNQCYFLTNAAALPGGNMIVQSMRDNITIVNIGAVIAGPALGVRVALAVRFVGTTNELDVYYDGVLQATRIDAVPSVGRAGLPGIAGHNIVNGSVLTISRLRCGLLSRLGY